MVDAAYAHIPLRSAFCNEVKVPTTYKHEIVRSETTFSNGRTIIVQKLTYDDEEYGRL